MFLLCQSFHKDRRKLLLQRRSIYKTWIVDMEVSGLKAGKILIILQFQLSIQRSIKQFREQFRDNCAQLHLNDVFAAECQSTCEADFNGYHRLIGEDCFCCKELHLLSGLG